KPVVSEPKDVSESTETDHARNAARADLSADRRFDKLAFVAMRVPRVRSATTDGRTMTLQQRHTCNARVVARAMRALVLAVPLFSPLGCATTSAQSGYQAFLQKIAVECKPLIIGADDMGQAIVFNGLGAIPVNYTNFLSMTSALYSGSV